MGITRPTLLAVGCVDATTQAIKIEQLESTCHTFIMKFNAIVLVYISILVIASSANIPHAKDELDVKNQQAMYRFSGPSCKGPGEDCNTDADCCFEQKANRCKKNPFRVGEPNDLKCRV